MIRLCPFNFAHKVVVNVNLLNTLAAAFVHLMYHDLLDEGVQHIAGQIFEAEIAFHQRKEAADIRCLILFL